MTEIERLEDELAKLEAERERQTRAIEAAELRAHQVGRGDVQVRLDFLRQAADARAALAMVENAIAGLAAPLESARAADAARASKVRELWAIEAAKLDGVIAATAALVSAYEDLEQVRRQVVGLGGFARSHAWAGLYQAAVQAQTAWSMFGPDHDRPGSINAAQPAKAAKPKATKGKPPVDALGAWHAVRAKLGGA
jgi:hypothetical protein